MLSVSPLTFAVTTPAAVEPLAASPVAPLPAAPLARTSYLYPLAGAGEAAVQDMVAVVAVRADALTTVGEMLIC